MITALSWLWNWLGSASGGAAPVVEYRVTVVRAARWLCTVTPAATRLTLARGNQPTRLTVTRDT